MVANPDAQLLNLIFFLLVFTIAFGAAALVFWILDWKPLSVMLLVILGFMVVGAVMVAPRSSPTIQRYQMDGYDCFLVTGQQGGLSCVRKE